MNAQFKKGVLELVVLISVAKKDMYGYEMVSEVSKVIDVNEGTIYPLLKRMTNERYFETYLQESTGGPPRKYYHLTKAGEFYKEELKAEWIGFQKQVDAFIRENDGPEPEQQKPPEPEQEEQQTDVEVHQKGPRIVLEKQHVDVCSIPVTPDMLDDEQQGEETQEETQTQKQEERGEQA